ncbi:MAG: histone deacetylase [Planctomycetota bacterium]|nr:histone deacetylase [Planctomycetota bacterium]
MFVYSPKYEIDWSGHIFPVEKYRLVQERLLKEGIARKEDFFEPRSVSEEELLLVHTKRYLERLRALTSHPQLAVYEFEAPITERTLEALYSCTGGTILAAKKALEEKNFWLNIGGGFHHAFSEHGEGFCFINDVAVAARVVQRDVGVGRILIVDCDLHQGNGTAKIFENDPSVFTFSIHQENLYPVKQRSSLDIGLDDFTGDEEYNARLKAAMEQIFEKNRFDLLFYLAGADPYEGDQLGLLKLTKEGLKKRDEIVFGFAAKERLPVAVVLAGGYAYRTEDVVEIHTNTARLMVEYNRVLKPR